MITYLICILEYNDEFVSLLMYYGMIIYLWDFKTNFQFFQGFSKAAIFKTIASESTSIVASATASKITEKKPLKFFIYTTNTVEKIP